jgi:hypothetical protein
MDATMQLINETWSEKNAFRNSDQYYITRLYAQQEYYRILALTGGVVPFHEEGQMLPRPRLGKNNETEFHIMVDFDSSVTQTQCHNDKFLREVQYKNYDQTATVGDTLSKKDSPHRTFRIQMPSAIYLSLAKLYESLDQSLRPLATTKEWIQNLSLRTNLATRQIYALYHNTCNKEHFVDKYRESWFYPLRILFLQEAMKANQLQEPISAHHINGRLWFPAESYPKRLNYTIDLGGVFTDLATEHFVSLDNLCGQHFPDVFQEYKR